MRGPCGGEPLRILLIGGLPPPLGGTSVSFRHLVTELPRLPGVEIEVIDTSRTSVESRGAALLTAIRIVSKNIGVEG